MCPRKVSYMRYLTVSNGFGTVGSHIITIILKLHYNVTGLLCQSMAVRVYKRIKLSQTTTIVILDNS